MAEDEQPYYAFIRKLSRVVDFASYLFYLLSATTANIGKSLEALPEISSFSAAGVVSDAFDSLRMLRLIGDSIIPIKCDDEIYNRFFYRHSTFLLFYHLDALALIRNSLLSAFMGSYSASFAEMRSALESVVWGIVMDLLAIPEYRANADLLKKISGFQNSPSFNELIRKIEEKYNNNPITISSEIFDIIDTELPDFNPQISFTRLLLQLKEWGVVETKEFQLLNNLYTEFSKRLHRGHARFTETGSRILSNKNWINLEPVSEELVEYLRKFTETNGAIAYLVLRLFNLDPEYNTIKNCINRDNLRNEINTIDQLLQSSDIAQNSPWRSVKQLIETLI